MTTSLQDKRPIGRHSDAGAAINLETLFTNCMGSVSFALTLLEELELSGMVHIETLSKHAAAVDHAATADAAHSLKGAASIIGAETLQMLAAEIELAAKTAGTENIAKLVGDIRHEMKNCLAQIPVIRLQSQLAALDASTKQVVTYGSV